MSELNETRGKSKAKKDNAIQAFVPTSSRIR